MRRRSKTKLACFFLLDEKVKMSESDETECRVCKVVRKNSFFPYLTTLRSNVKFCCSVANAEGKSCVEIGKTGIEIRRTEGSSILSR